MKCSLYFFLQGATTWNPAWTRRRIDGIITTNLFSSEIKKQNKFPHSISRSSEAALPRDVYACIYCTASPFQSTCIDSNQPTHTYGMQCCKCMCEHHVATNLKLKIKQCDGAFKKLLHPDWLIYNLEATFALGRIYHKSLWI